MAMMFPCSRGRTGRVPQFAPTFALLLALVACGAFAETPSVAANPVDLQTEIARLREDVLKLQQTLDVNMNGIVSELRAENERLRKELRDIYGGKGQALPPVPMPDKALLEGLTDVKKTTPLSPPQSSSASAAETEPPAEFKFEIVAEWGRTPEDAAAKTPTVSSLKGMIGLVPANSRDEDLIGLARSLRNQFEGYDNINIEVFDDAEAARTYKETHVAKPDRRVLSISKHAASDRDVIVLIHGDKTREIPLTDDSTPAG